MDLQLCLRAEYSSFGEKRLEDTILNEFLPRVNLLQKLEMGIREFPSREKFEETLVDHDRIDFLPGSLETYFSSSHYFQSDVRICSCVKNVQGSLVRDSLRMVPINTLINRR